jgi:hypothetical protein
MKESDAYLFYDGPYDALEKAIAQSGKPKKAIACAIYPGRQPDTAKSLLSRALTPDNTDVRISVENLIVILKETRPEDFIYYLCDEFGFERPVKKTKKDIHLAIYEELEEIKKKIEIVSKKIPGLDNDL